MPLVHVHLAKGKSSKYIKAVCEGIHTALKIAWKILPNDRFQLVSEYKKTHFHFDKTIWGINRSDDVIAIYITSISRPVAMKKKLYRELVRILGENPKVRKEDIFVTIVTIGREDWSFGNGIAQLTAPRLKP
jgi:phenylpyruvate tautomerase PptA (4-oxalocrotonate tautomerase family)